MNRRLPSLVLLLAQCLPLAALAAPVPEWQIVFQRETRVWKQGSPRPAEAQRDTLSVRLGTDYFYVHDQAEIRLVDLARARFARLEGTEKREEYPLLALVAARERELEREVDQITLMARSGAAPDDADARLFFAESRTGMKAALGAFPARLVPSGSEEKVWTVAGEFVAGWIPGRQKIPPAHREAYARMLAHQLPLHPEFQRQLRASDRLPQELRYRERIGARWKETRLLAPETGERPESLLPVLAKPMAVTVTAHPLSRAIATATSEAEDGPRPLSAADYGRQFRELVDRGLAAEALLAVLEFYLQTGADTEASMAKLDELSASDPDLLHLLDSMAIGSPAEAAASLANLARIDRGKLLRRHVYDITAANAMSALGRYREAEPLYLAALERNPWLTGVYKKLGDLYAQTERLPQAWTCYEAALRINGTHPMLKGVLAEAPRLRTEHPEFFLSRETGR